MIQGINHGVSLSLLYEVYNRGGISVHNYIIITLSQLKHYYARGTHLKNKFGFLIHFVVIFTV